METDRSCFISLLVNIVVVIIMIIPLQFCMSLDVKSSTFSILDAKNESVLSPQENFKLGFFSPNNSVNRYVGIWFNKVPQQTVVWVANRNSPLRNRNGVFRISNDGNIVVLSSENGGLPLWSSNISRTNSTATLLSSGNLVLTDNLRQIVWQSFDHPTDTVLLGMKFGFDRRSSLNRVVTCWNSDSDPSHGQFSIAFDPTHILPQVFIYKDSAPYARVPWNGWSPNVHDYTFVSNNEEVYILFPMSNASSFVRLVLDPMGIFRTQIWLYEGWSSISVFPSDECDEFSRCGPHAICSIETEGLCSCLPGFKKEDPGDVLSKCVGKRNVTNECGEGKGEGFLNLTDLKYPDARNALLVAVNMSLPSCEMECLNSCNCTAFASTNIQGGLGCFAWYGQLDDIRYRNRSGQDIYLRVDALELARTSMKKVNGKKRMLLILVPSVALVLLLFLSVYVWRRRVKSRDLKEKQINQDRLLARSNSATAEFDRPDLTIYGLDIVKAATNDFSPDTKLGEGGFGPVYRGKLPNGQEVAVKRLSKQSCQGTIEFKNEAMLIAQLQHRNLVKLLGCCVENDEKILIYEYMPNKSLDYFIFDENLRRAFDWKRRHEIMLGIARGLLYLHQDSRLKIIHRDLKASNVLLDDEYNPKVSDFGTARVFGVNQNDAHTNRVVGTYGYMSPEYALCGHFSVKSDVFSFGVLVLELITGTKKLGSFQDESCPNLISQVWQFWNDGKALEIIDSTISYSCPSEVVLRCIQVGLLCVQDHAIDRPEMSSVVFMLSNEGSVPMPKRPVFTVANPATIKETRESSENDMTITSVDGR